MMKVKICGLTTYEDALFAAEAGAHMLGFNFYKRSPRYIAPAQARAICSGLRQTMGQERPLLVGLFVNESVSTIQMTQAQVGFDAVQLSGDESAQLLLELGGTAFKAIRPSNKAMAIEDRDYYAESFPTDERLPSLLLDAYHPNLYGGTGEQASEEVALAVRERVPRLMLAGGLKPDNVVERINAIQPWAVDVASGVEPPGQPGIKDRRLVTRFIEAVQFA